MVDFRLLNGGKKVTIIEGFDKHCVLVFQDAKKKRFESLQECKKFIEEKDLEVNISFLFGAPAEK